MAANKVIFVFGTRPEAIKMAPLIGLFARRNSNFQPVVVVTAQHRNMLDQILQLFKIKPDYDLNIMRENQRLEDIVTSSLKKLSSVIRFEKPRMILVQGDTTTTFVGALAGFYNKISVGHVEAGLRTHDKYHPFPEEINRKLTSAIADFHFAPTTLAEDNLLKEGIPRSKIHVTGNTVIDALLEIVKKKEKFDGQIKRIFDAGKNKRIILLTTHRRENFGSPLENICSSIQYLLKAFEDVEIIFPVHPNPHVQKTVKKVFTKNDRVHLLPPMDYEVFAHVMNRSYMILTDSGGIQEEAPALGKPVLVLREKTERPEGVLAGTVKIVGTDIGRIVKEASNILSSKTTYDKMARGSNPYGDGKAAQRIFNIIHSEFS